MHRFIMKGQKRNPSSPEVLCLKAYKRVGLGVYLCVCVREQKSWRCQLNQVSAGQTVNTVSPPTFHLPPPLNSLLPLADKYPPCLHPPNSGPPLSCVTRRRTPPARNTHTPRWDEGRGETGGDRKVGVEDWGCWRGEGGRRQTHGVPAGVVPPSRDSYFTICLRRALAHVH